jgi:protein tyrosine kinase modulator
LKVLINETFYYRKPVVMAFIVINIVLLLLGLLWPKGYSAHTSIVVEDKKIIQPLMQGAAVPTEVTDRSRLAREIIFGRKIMNQIMEYAGWLKDNPSPTEQEKIIDRLTKRTSITTVGRDIINIEYRDDDPERAYKTTQKYAELFISESLGAKAAESQSAFEFIEKQTEEYHDKLIKAEEQLKEFRSANLDARPGSDADISSRLNLLQTRIEQATQDLKEAEVKRTSLEKQISGEAEVASVLSREGQFRSRVVELQSRLETLRMNYLDTYPDIVQIKHQIVDLNQAIVEERQRREQARAAGRVNIDEGVINNPLYQQLKQELSQTKTSMEMLSARISEAKHELQGELERGRRVHGGEATLAELTRDYQVNRDIYQDLLRRRENARVSMNLDKEKQGLMIKIQEPAALPLQPSGLRFIGLVLSVSLPLGVLYLKISLDPRIRVGIAFADKRKLPLLAVVPQLWSSAETQSVRRQVEWISFTIAGTIFVIGLTSVLRFVKII